MQFGISLLCKSPISISSQTYAVSSLCLNWSKCKLALGTERDLRMTTHVECINIRYKQVSEIFYS